ncbi:MAG TPA: FAD-dependent oxidoreductase [Caballeronia sp.]|nr:FAD-dependent oxidoreductase [Caballeronia sp.]
MAVVEEAMIGGSCSNVACIPSKALIQTARIMHAVQSADILKGTAPDAQVDMTQVHRCVREVVDGMVDINAKAIEASGFDLILGTGHFMGPRRIQVAMTNGRERVVEGVHVFINTGTYAAIPDIPGLRDAEPMTHVGALELDSLPEHLIVVGGGYLQYRASLHALA